MDANEAVTDASLFARLRVAWAEIDPEPADLVDRMVAAVATADLSREYAMLTLVEGSLASVRSEAATATLQFSDGTTSVLVHLSSAESGARRIDGWVDGTVLTIHLVQAGSQRSAEAGDQGRFAFDEVAPGLAHLSLVVRSTDDATREFRTPQFEV